MKITKALWYKSCSVYFDKQANCFCLWMCKKVDFQNKRMCPVCFTIQLIGLCLGIS